MPGQTVFENELAYTTVSSRSRLSIVGSGSPAKRIDTYGSSSKIVKPCSRARPSSASRFGALSV